MLYVDASIAAVWEVRCDDTYSPSCDVDVESCHAWVDGVEALDVSCPLRVGEKPEVPRASKDVLSSLRRPKFTAFCSPSFIQRNDVPCGVLELCNKLVYGLVFAETACFLVDKH